MFLPLKFVVFIKYWFGFSVDFSKLSVNLLDFKVTVLVDGAFLLRSFTLLMKNDFIVHLGYGTENFGLCENIFLSEDRTGANLFDTTLTDLASNQEIYVLDRTLVQNQFGGGNCLIQELYIPCENLKKLNLNVPVTYWFHQKHLNKQVLQVLAALVAGLDLLSWIVSTTLCWLT